VEPITKEKLMEDLRAVVVDAEELLKATAGQTAMKKTNRFIGYFVLTESDVTGWIEAKANELLENGLLHLKKDPFREGPGAITGR